MSVGAGLPGVLGERACVDDSVYTRGLLGCHLFKVRSNRADFIPCLIVQNQRERRAAGHKVVDVDSMIASREVSTQSGNR